MALFSLAISSWALIISSSILIFSFLSLLISRRVYVENAGGGTPGFVTLPSDFLAAEFVEDFSLDFLEWAQDSGTSVSMEVMSSVKWSSS